MYVCMYVCIYAHSMFIGLLLSNQNFKHEIPEPGLPLYPGFVALERERRQKERKPFTLDTTD